jgi:uncharacterized repeat protein (TIGR03843 family)
MFDPQEHAFTLLPGHEEAFRRIAAFDVVVNNADRKGGHTLRTRDGGIAAIDHGLCFHVVPKLRTVIWAFEGEPMGSAIAHDLRALIAALAPAGKLRAELTDLLDPDEIDAVAARTERLLEAGVFPAPDERVGPAYPWPPI